MDQQASPVVVMDVQMRFSSMVLFMVKWALASIPAFLILFAFGVGLFFAFGLLTATFGGLWGPARDGSEAHVSLQGDQSSERLAQSAMRR